MRRPITLAADSPTLQAYLQEIVKFPRLAIEEERELGERIKHDHDEDALHALVRANLRFVVAYAKRYRQLGVPFLDLIHEGNQGLLEAARHFDPDQQTRFVSHGAWWVRQSIMQRLAEAQTSALRAQLEHRPTAAEIAEDLDLADADAHGLLHAPPDEPALEAWVGVRRDDRDGEDFDDALRDQAIREIDDEQMRQRLVGEIERVLDELDPKERLLLRLRYGLEDDEPRSLPQIGERLRLDEDRVRRLEACALQKLRRVQGLRGGLN